MYVLTGHHVNDVRLPRDALNHSFFDTRLVACLERTTPNSVFVDYPGEDDDGDGEASGEFGITL